MIWQPAYPLLTVAQALGERNPAAHLIWFFAIVAFALVALIPLLEILDWIRDRWRRSPAGESGRAARRIEAADSTLRRRFFRRPPRLVRLWSQKMGSNEPWKSPPDSGADRS